MDNSVANLLYRRPELYEIIYPEPDERSPRFCMRAFEVCLGRQPASILDVGCGTARDLAVLHRSCPDCWGVDYLPEMVDYARRVRPQLNVQQGDMRTFRLGCRFEAVISLGAAITYALTNEELDQTMATLSVHAAPGAALVLDLTNAASLLPGGSFQMRRQSRIEADGLIADVTAEYEIDRVRQHLIRRRTWRMGDGAVEEDFCRYRMLFPGELAHLLERAGFDLLQMYDNQAMRETDLTGPMLYVIARRRAE